MVIPHLGEAEGTERPIRSLSWALHGPPRDGAHFQPEVRDAKDVEPGARLRLDPNPHLRAGRPRKKGLGGRDSMSDEDGGDVGT